MGAPKSLRNPARTSFINLSVNISWPLTPVVSDRENMFVYKSARMKWLTGLVPKVYQGRRTARFQTSGLGVRTRGQPAAHLCLYALELQCPFNIYGKEVFVCMRVPMVPWWTDLDILWRRPSRSFSALWRNVLCFVSLITSVSIALLSCLLLSSVQRVSFRDVVEAEQLC